MLSSSNLETFNFLYRDYKRFNLVKMKEEIEHIQKRLGTFVQQTEIKMVRLENLTTSQKVDKTNEDIKEL